MATLYTIFPTVESGYVRKTYDDAIFSYSGSWNIGTARKQSTVAGNTITFTINCSNLRIICTSDSSYGSGHGITIDGVSQGTWACNVVAGETQRVMCFEKSNLTSGLHTVVLTVGSGYLVFQGIDYTESGAIGYPLLLPETGWKRVNLVSTPQIVTKTGTWAYWGANTGFAEGSVTVTFKFKGTSLRFVTSGGSNRSSDASISIDGTPNTLNLSVGAGTDYTMVYEVTGLSNTIHTVILSSGTTNTYKMMVQSIDILNVSSSYVLNLWNGGLKNSLVDMQVGDTIPCVYTATSGVTGTFTKIGKDTNGKYEIDVGGSATPDGSFNFICVERKSGKGGLCIADRALQHTIAWDTLNAGKFIEGLSFNTPLLLNFEGVNEATSTTEGYTNRSFSMGTGSSIATADKKFGSSSAYFTGSATSYIDTIKTNIVGDFTISLFVNANTSDGTYDALISDGSYTTDNLVLFLNNAGKVQFYNVGTSRILSTTVIGSTGLWSHVALVRSDGVCRLYINGSQEGDSFAWILPIGGTNPIRLGSSYDSGTKLIGYLDGVEVLPFARWTANFTPPAIAPVKDVVPSYLIRSLSGGNCYADIVSEVPKMTSNTVPSGTVSASDFAGGQDPYKAFNGVAQDYGWTNAGTGFPCWVAYQFPSAKIITSYSIRDRADSVGHIPTSWKFQGSNDGTTWVDLDVRGGTFWTVVNQTVTFSFANTTEYTRYRLYVITSSSGTYVSIDEMNLWTSTPTAIPSGTNKGCGAYPTNNEWDRFISLSTLEGKITAGDPNVWHWASNNGGYTFCRETPSPLFGANLSSNRYIRGGSMANMGTYDTATAINWKCFRPALEFSEDGTIFY